MTAELIEPRGGITAATDFSSHRRRLLVSSQRGGRIASFLFALLVNACSFVALPRHTFLARQEKYAKEALG